MPIGREFRPQHPETGVNESPFKIYQPTKKELADLEYWRIKDKIGSKIVSLLQGNLILRSRSLSNLGLSEKVNRFLFGSNDRHDDQPMRTIEECLFFLTTPDQSSVEAENSRGNYHPLPPLLTFTDPTTGREFATHRRIEGTALAKLTCLDSRHADGDVDSIRILFPKKDLVPNTILVLQIPQFEPRDEKGMEKILDIIDSNLNLVSKPEEARKLSQQMRRYLLAKDSIHAQILANGETEKVAQRIFWQNLKMHQARLMMYGLANEPVILELLVPLQQEWVPRKSLFIVTSMTPGGKVVYTDLWGTNEWDREHLHANLTHPTKMDETPLKSDHIVLNPDNHILGIGGRNQDLRESDIPLFERMILGAQLHILRPGSSEKERGKRVENWSPQLQLQTAGI